MGVGTLKRLRTTRKPVELWEDQVFADAVQFTVTRFLGRGQHDRTEYKPHQFPEALAKARNVQPHERPFALYVVSSAGRSVCLERSKDEHWMALWKMYHGTA